MLFVSQAQDTWASKLIREVVRPGHILLFGVSSRDCRASSSPLRSMGFLGGTGSAAENVDPSRHKLMMTSNPLPMFTLKKHSCLLLLPKQQELCFVWVKWNIW